MAEDFFKLASKIEGRTKQAKGYAPKPYLERSADNFAKSAAVAIDFINGGTDKSSWATRNGKGFDVTFKNGSKVMELIAGKHVFAVKTKAEAIALIESSIEAAKAGKFDEQFEATKKAEKGTKAAAKK